MYRYSNGQISLLDFKQPVGMNLKETNRWVKKAQTIPWPEIEKRYSSKSLVAEVADEPVVQTAAKPEAVKAPAAKAEDKAAEKPAEKKAAK